MKILTYSAEVIGTIEAQDLRNRSLRTFPLLNSGYHYGASESNVTYPEGELERITLKAGRGNYKGLGTVRDALDAGTLMTDKRLKTQSAIVCEMIDALRDAGKGDYKVVKVITLFNPVKLFVLLSNGNEEDDILYLSVNGRSNGTGQRKELNWPEGVSKQSKRSKKAYWERKLKAAERNMASLKKYIAGIEAGIEAGKLEESYDGELEQLKEHVCFGEGDLKAARDGVARNS